MKPWCANCRIELPSDSSTNATERLTEFMSYHEGYEVKVTVTEAILTVFEGGIRANHAKIPVSRSIELCSQCTAVLAELYRFYVEFMKLSRQASYMQELLHSSILWEFGDDELGERDSKRYVLHRKDASGAGDNTQPATIDPELVPKVQIHADESEQNEPPSTPADETEVEEVISEATHQKKSKKAQPKCPCPICGKEFSRKSDTLRHIRTMHEKPEGKDGGADSGPEAEEEMELDDEDRFLRDAKKYAAEAEEGNKSTVFKCEQCEKTYRRKDYLKAHEKSHMSAEERKKELAQRKAIERLHSRSKARKPRKPIPKKQANSRRKYAYKCTECEQCFPTRETMKYHRRKVHPRCSYPCSGCDRIFHSENDLKIHENVKHGIGEKLADRMCPVPGCGKYFALPNIMRRHVQSVHCEEKDRIFECPFCPLKFPIKNRLDTHLKNRHNSDNSMQSLRCEQCDRVYETKSGLASHMETVHTNQKIYTCDICGRTSIRPEWLKKHLELHDSNREKKFGCPTCEMKFYRMASLKKHMKNHSGAKNYLCSECGDKFRQTSSLRRHIEAKHTMKNGPFNCDQCGKSFKIKEYLQQHLRAKSHGGRGHGLYTPAGKRRLERERQQQLMQETQEGARVSTEEASSFIGDGIGASLIEIKGDETLLSLPGPTPQQRQPPPLQPSQQQQHLIISDGARLVLIDGQHHLIQPASAGLTGDSHHAQVIELVITNADPGQSPQSSAPAISGSNAPLTATSSSQIQFLTTVNPTWFQHHSIAQIPQHVAAAAAASTSATTNSATATSSSQFF